MLSWHTLECVRMRACVWPSGQWGVTGACSLTTQQHNPWGANHTCQSHYHAYNHTHNTHTFVSMNIYFARKGLTLNVTHNVPYIVWQRLFYALKSVFSVIQLGVKNIKIHAGNVFRQKHMCVFSLFTFGQLFKTCHVIAKCIAHTHTRARMMHTPDNSYTRAT